MKSNPCMDEWVCGLSVHCRDGRPLNDDEIAGMLIGLLLAGQHTSSTTSAWMGFFLAQDRALQERCYSEQRTVCGEHLPPLHYDQVTRSTSAHLVLLLHPSSLALVHGRSLDFSSVTVIKNEWQRYCDELCIGNKLYLCHFKATVRTKTA